VIQSATLHWCISHTDSEHFLFSFGEGGVVITVAEKLVFRLTYSGSGGNRNVNTLLRQNEIAGLLKFFLEVKTPNQDTLL